MGVLGATDAGTCPSGAPCRPTPAPIPNLGDVVEVDVGHYFACALKRSGKVLCWGMNDRAQLGHAQSSAPGDTTCPLSATTFPCNPTPTEISDFALPPLTKIALGFSVACALGTDNRIYCWGNNKDGELGRGAVVPPTDAPGAIKSGPNEAFRDIAVGLSDSVSGTPCCAVRTTGEVVCWGGNNGYGVLGHDPSTDIDAGNPASPTPTAIAVTFVSPGTAVGYRHACALQTGGAVLCWGSNIDGELGIGVSDNGVHATPVAPTLLGGGTPLVAQAISLAYRTSYAVAPSGDLLAWGYNQNSQIANGASRAAHPSPTEALAFTVGAADFTAGEQFALARVADGGVVTWGRNGSAELGHAPSLDAGDIALNDSGAFCGPNPRKLDGLP
jgi:alpha-tubulin suppressor-like RCC1 family protein